MENNTLKTRGSLGNTLVLTMDEDHLEHYGTKRHSGRYPYGSGDDPYQRLTRGKGSKKSAKIVAKKSKQVQKDKAKEKKDLDKYKNDRKKNSPKKGDADYQTDVRKKRVSQMSDDELKDRIDRLKKEKEYRSLYNDLYAPKKNSFQKGKDFVFTALKDSGASTATYISRQVMTYYGAKFVNELIGDQAVNPKGNIGNKK